METAQSAVAAYARHLLSRQRDLQHRGRVEGEADYLGSSGVPGVDYGAQGHIADALRPGLAALDDPALEVGRLRVGGDYQHHVPAVRGYNPVADRDPRSAADLRRLLGIVAAEPEMALSPSISEAVTVYVKLFSPRIVM